jgi:hypothetical protein
MIVGPCKSKKFRFDPIRQPRPRLDSFLRLSDQALTQESMSVGQMLATSMTPAPSTKIEAR